MKIAIYPGTFDPITNGHLDVIERASSLFDKVIVSVLKKTDNKEVLFNEQERLSLVSKSVQKFSNVEVDIFDGLLIKYAELKDASAVIRGLRAISDFEYEFQMALMNRNLNEKVRTLFLMPHQKYIHISSSLVKEVAQLKGDISQYVPEHVNQLLKDRYN
jgi:pantetheine-phosphate adenylyltransferase|tara:strand:- start:1096 stop:1575 length:480 start_codon:yes stop_codon:yes gene_type:complete